MANHAVVRRRKSTVRLHTVGVLSFALVGGIAACADDSPTLPARVDRSFVTGGAERALQADGRFSMPDSVVNPKDQVNEAQARAIASLYVKAFAPTAIGSWNELHGAKINAEELRPCDRALYAISPYISFSIEVSENARRTFGPHWVVPMCGSIGRVQVVISFSSLATEMTADVGPKEPRPWERGHFGHFGVPKSAASDLYSPEAAASRAFQATGKRVAQVPLLLRSPMPTSPGLVRWRTELEAPVTVRGKDSDVRRERRSLFVGFGSVLGISGLLDKNPSAEVLLSWKDAGGKPFTVTLSPLAPAGVEVVETEGR